ncbi:MAG: ABC transporter ATP-binding protein, partial [Actinomycetota bacterium]
MSEAPLDVCAATKRFGDTVAVNGIDLTLDEHEVAAVVGPSGCGKSTLLRMIGGLEHLDSGAIRLAGRLVDDGRTQRPPERRSVGLVFQEHALFPHLTVAANVAFGLRDHAKSAVIERVAEMLGVVSLDGYDARYPHELSGGERQRVALARALAPSPALMLFDEPFASLDRNLRDDLRRQVLAALRATGTAALIVTHDQHEALSMGDRIAVMRAGSLVQLDTPSAVFHTPADRFTAAFMGEASFLPVERTDGRPATCLGPLDDPSSTAPITMVRPDDVAYRTLETSTPTTRGAVSADVVATE